jgi:hypothetical protein
MAGGSPASDGICNVINRQLCSHQSAEVMRLFTIRETLPRTERIYMSAKVSLRFPVQKSTAGGQSDGSRANTKRL